MLTKLRCIFGYHRYYTVLKHCYQKQRKAYGVRNCEGCGKEEHLILIGKQMEWIEL